MISPGLQTGGQVPSGGASDSDGGFDLRSFFEQLAQSLWVFNLFDYRPVTIGSNWARRLDRQEEIEEPIQQEEWKRELLKRDVRKQEIDAEAKRTAEVRLLTAQLSREA